MDDTFKEGTVSYKPEWAGNNIQVTVIPTTGQREFQGLEVGLSLFRQWEARNCE